MKSGVAERSKLYSLNQLSLLVVRCRFLRWKHIIDRELAEKIISQSAEISFSRRNSVPSRESALLNDS